MGSPGKAGTYIYTMGCTYDGKMTTEKATAGSLTREPATALVHPHTTDRVPLQKQPQLKNATHLLAHHPILCLFGPWKIDRVNWTRAETYQASYPLTFSPARATGEDIVSKLILADMKDKTKPVKFEFDLRGAAEEPLAEGHRIVRCCARERVEQVFSLKNTTAKGETCGGWRSAWRGRAYF